MRLHSAKGYEALVLQDQPRWYWPMDEAPGATTLAARVGDTALELTGGTCGVPGMIGTGVRLDGTINDRARTVDPLAAGDCNQLTLEMLIKWGDFTNAWGFIWELSPNYNSRRDSFLLIGDGGPFGGSTYLVPTLRGVTDHNYAVYPRFSANTWHHIAVFYDLTLPSNEVDVQIDGALLTALARPLNTNNTGGFFSNTQRLHLGYRASVMSAFSGVKTMQKLAVYPRRMSTGRMAQHAAAAMRGYP